jgi:plastocyanin
MKFSFTWLAVFLPVIVNAQSDAGDVNVIVAPGDTLTYNPSNFTASNGTNINFMFSQSVAHSVTQSTFESPCTYLAGGNDSSGGGFDSGIQLGKLWTITITNDQEPIYFFCKSSLQHCGSGMVGAINAPDTGPNSPDAFLSAAMAIGTNEGSEVDNGPVIGGVNAVATATPTPTSATSSSSASPSSSKSSDARHLVASGIFAFLASALSITIS